MSSMMKPSHATIKMLNNCIYLEIYVYIKWTLSYSMRKEWFVYVAHR